MVFLKRSKNKHSLNHTLNHKFNHKYNQISKKWPMILSVPFVLVLLVIPNICFAIEVYDNTRHPLDINYNSVLSSNLNYVEDNDERQTFNWKNLIKENEILLYDEDYIETIDFFDKYDESDYQYDNDSLEYQVEYCLESVNEQEFVTVETLTDYGKDHEIIPNTKHLKKNFDGYRYCDCEHLQLVDNQIIPVVKIKYQRNNYTLNFDFNGGLSEPEAMSVKYSSIVDMPKLICKKEGMIFDCWCYDKECTSQVTWPYVFNTTSNVTFYAKWKELNQYCNSKSRWIKKEFLNFDNIFKVEFNCKQIFCTHNIEKVASLTSGLL